MNPIRAVTLILLAVMFCAVFAQAAPSKKQIVQPAIVAPAVTPVAELQSVPLMTGFDVIQNLSTPLTADTSEQVRLRTTGDWRSRSSYLSMPRPEPRFALLA